MGNNDEVYVDVDSSVIEQLKRCDMFDVLVSRFLGSGAVVRMIHEEWDAFRSAIKKMIDALPEKDRNYAVNYGGYPMERVFQVKTYEAFMAEVAQEASQENTVFEHKFNGLLTADVFDRWLARLQKTAKKQLGTVLMKKAELYSVVITKITIKATEELEDAENMETKLVEMVIQYTEGVRRCICSEEERDALIEEVNEYLALWDQVLAYNESTNEVYFEKCNIK